jgi:hypothetical protein
LMPKSRSFLLIANVDLQEHSRFLMKGSFLSH